jgi:hypothetical protein
MILSSISGGIGESAGDVALAAALRSKASPACLFTMLRRRGPERAAKAEDTLDAFDRVVCTSSRAPSECATVCTAAVRNPAAGIKPGPQPFILPRTCGATIAVAAWKDMQCHGAPGCRDHTAEEESPSAEASTYPVVSIKPDPQRLSS